MTPANYDTLIIEGTKALSIYCICSTIMVVAVGIMALLALSTYIEWSVHCEAKKDRDGDQVHS